MRAISTTFATVALLAGSGVANAAIVNASYSGVIAADSGLGLLGQELRADLSYDDSAPATPSGNSHLYQDFLQSLVVTIGPNSWTYDATNGSDAMFLYNDAVLSFAVGVEDQVIAFVDNFVGPDLGTGAVAPGSFSFSLLLSDNVPFGSPDALDASAPLPTIAPVPELFNREPGPDENRMTFAWFTGDPEFGGTFYQIVTDSVVTPAVIPVPAAGWLLASAVAATVVGRRRRGVGQDNSRAA
jgi:hypothetical protein